MGWVWKDDDDGEYDSSSYNAGDTGEVDVPCGTRRIVSSQCKTEEVEPGKFIRKCEKTEQIFKECVGRPSEMIQSNKEYTEEDITDQVVRGSARLGSPEQGPFHFPGLHDDIEAIERKFFGGINRFFEAAEEMKNFFNTIPVPHIFDDNPSSSHNKHGIPVEAHPPKEALPNKGSDGDVDLSGLAADV